MAKSRQTFQKRQRENKLREKAQRKRERRQERTEKKKSPGDEPEADAFYPPIIEYDPDSESEPDIEESAQSDGSSPVGDHPIFQQQG